MKDQKQKIRDLLESKGLKGTPTMENCKALRVKMETEAEVASLDLNNIINEKVKRGEKSASNVTESQNSHVFVVAVVVVVSVLVLGG